MKVTSKQEAWNKVNEIFPTDYAKDEHSSNRAGYPVYRSTAEGHHCDYICDLGDRLEVNLDSSHFETVNIWIEHPAQEPPKSSVMSARNLPSGSRGSPFGLPGSMSRSWPTRKKRTPPSRPCRPSPMMDR